MPKPALFLIITFILVRIVTAQDLPDAHERIREFVDGRNYRAAASQLRELETNSPAIFKANNYDYLLGRISEKIGDNATAMASFQSVATRNSPLKEYALWHMSRVARASGNLMLERVYLEELIAFSRESLLFVPASQRLAASWFDSGNYDLAIKQVDARATSAPSSATTAAQGPTLRKETAFLAEAYLRAGNIARARELFTTLTTEHANPAQPDDFALAGALGLDTIERASGATSTLSDYEHLRRAGIYQFNRDFENARVHYAAIINDHPSSGLVPDAIFQTGRGYVQQNDFTESLKYFERVIERFPDHPVCQDAQLQAASAYARLGKYREGVSRYKKYIEKYPQGERIDRAYLNIIDVLRDQREEIEAIKWAATTRDRFKGKQPEALATFAEARIYLGRSDWVNALTALDRVEALPDLGGATVPGGTTIAEVRFLRALALESLRRFPEAIDIYLSIPDGRNEYYGWRATERLRLMAQDETAKKSLAAKASALKEVRPTDPDGTRRVLQASLRVTDQTDERTKLLAPLRAAYGAIPAYGPATKFRLVRFGRREPVNSPSTSPTDRSRVIPDELLFLGLYDEAAPEVEMKGATIAKDEKAHTKADLDYTIAVLYTRGDMAYRGSAFIESVWKKPADHQIELIPTEVLDLLYPAPYVDALVMHAPQRNVDPRYLLSIMRQESRFRPDVKSYAAARGLMQFISTTAARVAAELERESFQQDDLYDPSTAILFGSHYTGNLVKLFPGQPSAVAASYNGGEDNMKRWLARAKSDQPDRYVPEIIFSQSKDYVYRVMANYRMYQLLYDENLRRK